MISLCIKSNNLKTLNHIFSEIQNLSLENLYISQNSFKTFNNIIMHYKGQNKTYFYNAIIEILNNTILNYYEKNFIKRILNYNYFYFNESEKSSIVFDMKNYLDSTEKERKKILYQCFYPFLINNKYLYLDGFITFRLKSYYDLISNILDTSVTKFVIEKEYKEFINLLKLYISSNQSRINSANLIYYNNESILLDDNFEIIPLSKEISDINKLSNIIFTSNDFALNTLLSILPQKIYIHLISEADEFIDSLINIFSDRISICNLKTNCEICNTFNTIFKIEI